MEFEKIDGVPYIQGQKAVYDPLPDDDIFKDIWSNWKCPICNAHLSAQT